MSWSLSASGHAATAEAEAEVVKLIHDFVQALEGHNEQDTVSAYVSTQNHGSGTAADVNAVANPVPEVTPEPTAGDTTTQGGTGENGAS